MILEALLAAGSVVFGMFISYFTFIRNRDKDVRQDATENAKVSAKLDHISRGVDDIRIDLKSNEREINRVAERVTRVEESTKQAHLRINKIENRKE